MALSLRDLKERIDRACEVAGNEDRIVECVFTDKDGEVIVFNMDEVYQYSIGQDVFITISEGE